MKGSRCGRRAERRRYLNILVRNARVAVQATAHDLDESIALLNARNVLFRRVADGRNDLLQAGERDASVFLFRLLHNFIEQLKHGIEVVLLRQKRLVGQSFVIGAEVL